MRMTIQTIAIIVLGGSILSSQAFAGNLGPQKPSDLVTVQTRNTDCSGFGDRAKRIDSQLLPDGTRVTFSIPSKKVFIITEVGFILQSNASSTIEVLLLTPTGPSQFRKIIDTTVTTDTLGQGGTEYTLSNGIAIKPGVELCVIDLFNQSPQIDATLHGYFAKDK